MSTLYNSLPITSCCRTVCDIMGVPCGEEAAPANEAVKALCDKAFSGRKADRALLYNPDAIALWLYQNYTHLFTGAMVNSRLAIPMLSVMPSVTPVCFGSMYTGMMPDQHGIKKYVKPVLTVDTIFDHFIRAGKKCAIVSTTGDSGMVRGGYVSGQEGYLRMDYLPSDAVIRNRDQVCTAGSTVYPKDLILGYVVDAGYEETGVAKFALLEPAVELGSLEQIFVLMAFDADTE